MEEIKKSKYNSKKITCDNYKFDSLLEKNYYLNLKNKKENWEIKDYKVHPTYQLFKWIKYILDFLIEYNDWNIEVIDIKWLATPVAKIKLKLFKINYPNIKINWIVYYNKQWVDYFENEKRKQKNKKEKKKLLIVDK